MKFTVSWLKKYIDIDIPAAKLADKLTMLGLEVDSVDQLHGELANVKVARVEAVNPHPNADKLTVCDVAVGKETKRVVCGAPNVKSGMVTVIALPGAVLPGGFRIKKAKLRGEASEGMLCSEKELGLGEGQAGIMDLPSEFKAGMDLAEALQLQDVLIEVDLTPNRPDCASVIGIAREAAGFTGSALRQPVKDKELPQLSGKDVPFSIEVKDPDACPRYAARLLKNVTIGPSPWWLQRTLLAVGQRPINNIVDITNYVMLEYGQPLHAFDFAKLAGGKIVVRKAKKGEKITTLDGVEHKLDPEMLLICDAEKGVALAGVMGGENSEVSDATTDILLESAYFDPISIRRTARQTNLATESSYRFERGVDPQGVAKALERAVQLMQEIAGATVVENGYDVLNLPADQPAITLRTQRTNDLLGTKLSTAEIAKALAAIEIPSKKQDANTLLVQPPSFRVDLEREVDLIEEIARLVGYNSIPTTLPQVPMSFPETSGLRFLRKDLTRMMVAMGFYESINYSFVSTKYADMLGLGKKDEARTAVKLLNPLAEEQSIMRTMLLPGVLENLRHNINHQNSDVRLFEIGKTFLPGKKELPEERLILSAVISGRKYPDASPLHFGNNPVDLLDVKGVAEQLLAELRIADLAYMRDASAPAYVAADQYIEILSGKKRVGWFGRISDGACKQFGIKQEVFGIELDVMALDASKTEPKAFRTLPRFPWVKWDIAMLVPEDVGGGDILAVVENAGEKLIESVEIFDIYRGKNVDQGYKSIGISITYRSAEQTLDDATVEKVHKKIIELVLSRFGGKLREV